ncbi:oligogalacturonate-specific porin KdgM family protein, partial [Klebsiella pneumoniae]
LMMSLWDALRMNMMISYQELVRTFLNRGDAWAGFVLGDWRTELNYVYARSSEGVSRNDNKPYSQEYNVKVAYKLDNNWSPYGEIGNVGVNDRSDRQTRFRVGVAYSF